MADRVKKNHPPLPANLHWRTAPEPIRSENDRLIDAGTVVAVGQAGDEVKAMALENWAFRRVVAFPRMLKALGLARDAIGRSTTKGPHKQWDAQYVLDQINKAMDSAEGEFEGDDDDEAD